MRRQAQGFPQNSCWPRCEVSQSPCGQSRGNKNTPGREKWLSVIALSHTSSCCLCVVLASGIFTVPLYNSALFDCEQAGLDRRRDTNLCLRREIQGTDHASCRHK